MEPRKIHFHYKKSNHFRVIHADGAWGGITPDLNLFIGFYSQRPPIPEMTVQPIQEDGTLGSEIKDAMISKDGLVREMEAGIVMSPAAINNLITWLLDKQKLFTEIQQKQNDVSPANSATHG